MVSLMDKTTEIEGKHSSQQLLHIYIHNIIHKPGFLNLLKRGMKRVGFLDKTLPICYKEYVKKTEGDTVRMRVICQSYSNTRIAFCSIWEATPFKTNTLPI